MKFLFFVQRAVDILDKTIFLHDQGLMVCEIRLEVLDVGQRWFSACMQQSRAAPPSPLDL